MDLLKARLPNAIRGCKSAQVHCSYSSHAIRVRWARPVHCRGMATTLRPLGLPGLPFRSMVAPRTAPNSSMRSRGMLGASSTLAVVARSPATGGSHGLWAVPVRCASAAGRFRVLSVSRLRDWKAAPATRKTSTRGGRQSPEISRRPPVRSTSHGQCFSAHRGGALHREHPSPRPFNYGLAGQNLWASPSRTRLEPSALGFSQFAPQRQGRIKYASNFLLLPYSIAYVRVGTLAHRPVGDAADLSRLFMGSFHQVCCLVRSGRSCLAGPVAVVGK